jgi:endonuclease/exonuclease/phosphatase family metal-dependent hydrolase
MMLRQYPGRFPVHGSRQMDDGRIKRMNSKIDRFSVMTLNLRFGLADDGPNAWKYRKKLIPALFRDYPVDFIACQEVNAFQADDLAAILTDYHFTGRREPAPPFWQNNIIFFKKGWELHNPEHFYLSDTPDIPSRARNSQWPRQCTMGTFQKMKRRLTCINTHFDFSSSAQTFSAGLIMKRLHKRPDPVPAILMGDFNAPIDSPHNRIFVNDVATGKDVDIGFHNAVESPAWGTHHGFSGKPGKACIDWILYTDGITREDAKVVEDHVNGAYYSDHFPVVASFSFPGTG